MGETNVGLTSTEISNIWSSYLKSSMELRFFQYFFETTDDVEVKKIVEKMVSYSEQSLNDLKAIFLKDSLTIPLGFTDKDVRLDADKVFSDTFILYICHDITMLSLSTYPSALPDCTRRDIRDYFQRAIDFTMKIQDEITSLMLQQGIFLKSPQVAKDAYTTAFFTSSSIASLPVAIESARKAGISEKMVNFSLPLGAVFNSDGGALRMGASIVFAANVTGISFSLTDFITIVLIGTLLSIGTAGIPAAGLVTLSVVLTMFDLPLEVVALIAGVDAIIGMAGTASNVVGDVVGAAVVDQSEKKAEMAGS